MRYTIAIHHHRFAAWAAARAAQRGLANSRAIIDALNGCGVVEVIDTPGRHPATAGDFDRLHREWCRALLGWLHRAGIKRAKYGRAAKVIAIYLKSRVVLSGHHDTPFAKVIHPPIDSTLLKAVARHLRSKCRSKYGDLASRLRAITWTSLEEAEYDLLIKDLRGVGLNQPAFWCIERFWNPWEDEPPLAECE